MLPDLKGASDHGWYGERGHGWPSLKNQAASSFEIFNEMALVSISVALEKFLKLRYNTRLNKLHIV
jgi:hypothetical protein